jgi:hypothetical protein
MLGPISMKLVGIWKHVNPERSKLGRFSLEVQWIHSLNFHLIDVSRELSLYNYIQTEKVAAEIISYKTKERFTKTACWGGGESYQVPTITKCQK